LAVDSLILPSPAGEEILRPTTLLIAIDETGHEELADPAYPVFGLGGCLTVVADYHSCIQGPWTALKERHFSGAHEPLHATGLNPTPDQAAAIGEFFKTNTFGRFAAVSTPETSLGTPLSRYESTALSMAHCLTAASAEYTFDRIAVIFEHSERTEPLVRRVFSPQSNYPDAAARWRVPTQFFFASKMLAEPIVEVADFVMHAAGTAVRSNLKSPRPFTRRRDFASVFEGGLARRASFLQLEVLSPPGHAGGAA